MEDRTFWAGIDDFARLNAMHLNNYQFEKLCVEVSDTNPNAPGLTAKNGAGLEGSADLADGTRRTVLSRPQ